MESQTERGIDPKTLLGLVENTTPFLFSENQPQTPYTLPVLSAHREKRWLHKDYTDYEYYQLCLCAHYTTVASFVPTDVDNQIRKNLWQNCAELEKTTNLVLDSLDWDFRPMTARFQMGKNAYLSGHQGEWFSVAVGAYAANKEAREMVQKMICAELEQESRIFLYLKEKLDGIGLLRASTVIAHNLGDLDRVIDQWELPAEDPLRKKVYKLGHEKNPSFGPLQIPLLEAGALNKAFMASENHRHYPLRGPKCLRKSRDFFLPIGPFFDAWGEKLARHPLLSEEEKAEIVLALLDGFQRLSSPQIPLYGYARAIGGFLQNYPGGANKLLHSLPAKPGKLISTGLIAQINQTNVNAFQSQWAKKALKFLHLAK